MIRSTATVLGFLFFLSVAYYLSFWSYFDINIFQYMAVEDIIKGIAYPLRYAGIWILGFFTFLVLLFISFITIDTADLKLKLSKRTKKVVATFSLLTLLMVLFFYAFSDTVVIGMALSITVSFLIIFVYAAMLRLSGELDEVGRKQAVKASPMSDTANWFSVYCAIFLTVNSVVSGQMEATRIQSGKEYNYVMTVDLKEKVSTSNPYLLFLGAVSEKYIFIDREGGERFILDKTELTSLKVHHFDAGDPRTIKHMNATLKRNLAEHRGK